MIERSDWHSECLALCAWMGIAVDPLQSFERDVGVDLSGGELSVA